MGWCGVWTVIKNSRWYSADMTVFSCLVCFLYALGENGSVVNGIIAFIGILFAHMATNLYDDYSDYKVLSQNPRASEFAPDVKCDYLRKNFASKKDLVFVISLYCIIALETGVILFFRAGDAVLGLAAIGGVIVLSYPLFSRVGLSEVAVGIAFGPLLFEGMYYVMTKSFSAGVMLLGLSVVMFTVGVMYVHTLLDYEGDRAAGKYTLALRMKDKDTAYKFFWIIYVLGYIFLVIFSILEKKYFCLAGLFSFPFVLTLYKAVIAYNSPENYMRDEAYLRVLKSSARVMAFFAFLVAVGVFLNLLVQFYLTEPIVI